MSQRNRSWRIHQAKRVQKKRFNQLVKSNQESWVFSPSCFGKLKKNHFGCGCPLCKPWKHGLGNLFTHSDKKKLD